MQVRNQGGVIERFDAWLGQPGGRHIGCPWKARVGPPYVERGGGWVLSYQAQAKLRKRGRAGGTGKGRSAGGKISSSWNQMNEIDKLSKSEGLIISVYNKVRIPYEDIEAKVLYLDLLSKVHLKRVS